jgi:hypothetical protein
MENPAATRKTMPRWLRRTLWITGWTVTLLMLAVAIENWLGAREWRSYLAEARAAGDSLDLAAVIPPPAADEENFAAIPLFKPLFDYDRAAPLSHEFLGHPTWRDPAGKERLENLRPFGNAGLKQTRTWRLGEIVDLSVWQEQLSKEFPAELSPPSTPGQDVLRVLARFDGDMNALRAAAARPRSRFPIRYEEHIATPMPHLNVLLAFGKVARVRALAHLALGNAAAASSELMLGLRIAAAPSEEPLLISQLVVASLIDQLMQPIWEGLNRHQWNDAQLASMETALARFDLLTGYQRGLRGERSVLGMQALDVLKQQPQMLFSVFDAGKGDTPFFVRMSSVFLPSGWVDFNKAYLCRFYDQQVRMVKPEEHRFDASAVDAQEKEDASTAAARRGNPRKMITAFLTPQLSLLQQRCAVGQATADLARVAVAIERFRLRHQSLPARLDMLAPDFLAKVPRDVITGESLHYRSHPDGSFELYSVGWNERDDGGAHAVQSDSKPPEIDWRTGDWPWPQPAKLPGAE